MNEKTAKRHGFTLIELLLVLTLLGIIASLAVPHFAESSTDARTKAARAQIQILRRQIELYRVEHGNTLPNLTAGWTPLTGQSTVDGKLVGPYLPAAPKNPYNHWTNIADGTANLSGGTKAGFVYDYNNGLGTGRIYMTGENGKKLVKD